MGKDQKIKVLLTVSLVANLVFGGLIVGRWIAGPLQPPPLLWALRALPDESRDELRPLLRRQFMDSREVRRELHHSAEAVRELVEAESLNEQALRDSLATLREVTGRYQVQIHDSAVKIMQTLPADERRRVARALLRPEGAPRPKHHGE